MICFLVNADHRIGAGHFLRCMNLAKELYTRGHKIMFTSWSMNDEYRRDILANHFDFETIDSPEQVTDSPFCQKVSLLIIDTDDTRLYEKQIQLRLVENALKFMIITVNDHYKYYSNILLNQSIITLNQEYTTEDYTKKLLGPSYFIYNDRYRDIKKQKIQPPGKDVFIGFGAADPMNYTYHILKKFSETSRLRGYTFHVVIGGLNMRYSEINAFAKNCGLSVNIHHNIRDMEKVYRDCNVAICSPGSMFWELCLFGIQSFILSSSAREMESAAILHDKGFAHLVHQYGSDLTNEELAKMVEMIDERKNIAKNILHLQELISPNGIKKICNVIEIELNNDR